MRRGKRRRSSLGLETGAGRRAGAEILHEDIGARDDALQERAIGWRFDIEASDSLPRLSQTK